ncbi:hypothetical protein C3E98_044350, partial [Pseudomonas sp. MWU13-2625]
MATKQELVDGAYEEIVLAGYVFDLSPEERETGLRRLDRLAAEWDALGIRVGYNLASADGSSLEDESGLPD